MTPDRIFDTGLQHHVVAKDLRQTQGLIIGRLSGISGYFDKIIQRYPLKRHVCLTAFIKNANCFFINHGHAGITCTIVFIQQQSMLLGPGQSTVR